mmetsp:Transcript_27863/g.59205  ORF Transcript_27863/g.59205 Transcript_27863/m.59205 type:complete len:223 (+) Transcript_27863:2798-3466(+)
MARIRRGRRRCHTRSGTWPSRAGCIPSTRTRTTIRGSIPRRRRTRRTTMISIAATTRTKSGPCPLIIRVNRRRRTILVATNVIPAGTACRPTTTPGHRLRTAPRTQARRPRLSVLSSRGTSPTLLPTPLHLPLLPHLRRRKRTNPPSQTPTFAPRRTSCPRASPSARSAPTAAASGQSTASSASGTNAPSLPADGAAPTSSSTGVGRRLAEGAPPAWGWCAR